MKKRFLNTPELMPEILLPNEVFVYGANSLGQNLGGAAKAASLHYGAVMGEIHRTGRCYGLITLDWSIDCIMVRRLTSKELQQEFELFLKQVDLESEKTFYLTKVGIGIAGFELDEIVLPLKAAILNSNKVRTNLILPIEFEERLIELDAKTFKISLYKNEVDTTVFTTAC